MSTLELKANAAFKTTRPSYAKSYDFTIIWSYAIAALAILVVIYGSTATSVGSSVDFASLSMAL
jgi:hypothetical protein